MSQLTSNGMNFRPRVIHVVTSDRAATLIRGQLRFLEERGFDVTLVCSPGKWLDDVGRMERVKIVELPMEREIAPLKDFVSLWRLHRVIRAIHPDVTNVSTPKAGLLGGCAAWLNGVPCRFYTLRGLRFETSTGLRRRLLVFAERIACHFAHRVICVSKSLRETAIASGLTNRERTVVFGFGSSNGVNLSRFEPTKERKRLAADWKAQLGIPSDASVIGFVGRLTRDKGISELVESFLRLKDQFQDLRLILLGSLGENEPPDGKTLRHLHTHPHIILAGEMVDTAPFYSMIDILVLPSHREGLPNVVLEALAARKPVVAARATGIVDAIVDGENGLLFPVGDVPALVNAIAKLLTDKTLASQLARAGQELIKLQFRQELIWEALSGEYHRFLRKGGLSLPTISSTDRVADP